MVIRKWLVHVWGSSSSKVFKVFVRKLGLGAIVGVSILHRLTIEIGNVSTWVWSAQEWFWDLEDYGTAVQAVLLDLKPSTSSVIFGVSKLFFPRYAGVAWIGSLTVQFVVSALFDTKRGTRTETICLQSFHTSIILLPLDYFFLPTLERFDSGKRGGTQQSGAMLCIGMKASRPMIPKDNMLGAGLSNLGGFQ